MSAEQTGRIIDLNRKRKQAIDINIELRDVMKRPSLFRKMGEHSTCSMCKHMMSKATADLQIENKRENAPICVACILGKPRKEKGTSKWANIHKTRTAIKNGIKYTKEKDDSASRKKELDKLFDR